MWQKIFEFRLPVLDKDVTIYSFGTIIVVAFLVGSWWARRKAFATLALDKDRVFNVCFAMLFLGLFGARLLYALGHYAEFTKRPLSFLYIWEGGLVWYGGLGAALLWLAWYLPRHAELKGFALLDVLARGTCLALFLGWFASLAAGDQFGKTTEVAWGLPGVKFEAGTQALKYVNDQAVSQGVDIHAIKLHPTQVYESLVALLWFFVLGAYAKKAPRSGRVVALFLMLHAVGRVVVEIWRADDAQRTMVVPGTLSLTQLLSIPLFFAGLAVWMIRRPERPHAAPRPS